MVKYLVEEALGRCHAGDDYALREATSLCRRGAGVRK
jgi:hypothetical protein